MKTCCSPVKQVSTFLITSGAQLTVRLPNIIQFDADGNNIPAAGDPAEGAAPDRVSVVGATGTVRCRLAVTIPLRDRCRQVVVDFSHAIGPEHESCRKALVATVLSASRARFGRFNAEARVSIALPRPSWYNNAPSATVHTRQFAALDKVQTVLEPDAVAHYDLLGTLDSPAVGSRTVEVQAVARAKTHVACMEVGRDGVGTIGRRSRSWQLAC